MIQPRFIASTIREPSIRTTDGNVHDEIEGLVERRDVLRAVLPRVGCRDEVGVILDDGREITALEERLVELEVERVRESGVDVDSEELRRPLQRERVELVRKSLPPVRPPPKCLTDAVEPRERPPVERSSDVVDTPVEWGKEEKRISILSLLLCRRESTSSPAR